MKTTLYLLLILVFCSSLQAADPNEEIHQAEIARLQAQLQALQSQTQTPSETVNTPPPVQGDLPLINKQLIKQEKKLAEVRTQLAQAKSSGLAIPSSPRPVPFSFNFGQPSRRILILPGPDTDMGQVTEDLTIMSKILADRLQEQGLASWSGWPNTHSIEAMAIDGYGVMFILTVDFPLQKQAEQPAPTQTDKGDSVWRNTRDELNNPHWELYHQAPQETAKPYDANQVEKLKETLCGCLKHATNIHSVQGQQWVVVVVEAGTSGNTMNVVGSGRAFLQSGTGDQKSTMVIKVHKADIDRFAADQLDPKDFQHLVQIQTYAKP